jgi:hypothetical protein
VHFSPLFSGPSETAIFTVLILRARSIPMFDAVKNNRTKKCLSRAGNFLRDPLFPSPAQYRVEPHLIGEIRQTDGNEPRLRCIEGALRIQNA